MTAQPRSETSGRQKKRKGAASNKATASKKPVETQKSASAEALTDEEKRGKKNAYIRDWRKSHKDEYAAYMKAWREKKAKAAGKTSPKRKTSSKKTAVAKRKEQVPALTSPTSASAETPAE